MSDAPTPSTSSTVAVAPAPSLPLRKDELLGAGLMLKVALFTALLLALAYVALRFYVRLQRRVDGDSPRPALRCEAALRLSPRTRVYVVTVGDARVLVTESTAGNHVLLLPNAAVAPSPESAFELAPVPEEA